MLRFLTIRAIRLVTLGYVGTLMLFALLPDYLEQKGPLNGVIGPPLADVLHIPAYALLAWLLLLNLRGYEKTGVRALLVAVGIAFVYGGLVEYCQAFVPGRESSVYDCLYNLSGIVVVLGWYVTHKTFAFARMPSRTGE